MCENNIAQVDKIWQALFPLFKATNKHRYSFFSIYTCFVVKHAHQLVKDVVSSWLVLLREFANRHIGGDTVTKKINLEER